MRYYLIAGEASGDLHGSNLIKELIQVDKQAEFRFWGGDLMEKHAKTKPVKHYKSMAFMGFVKVVLNIRTIKRNIDFCKKDLLNYKPDALVLIDYAGFNLQIAAFAKKHNIPVHYYISPKIWAWKTNRIHKIKKYVDNMLTILPFETEFYANYDYPVTYVGNPLLDAIANRDSKEENFQEYCSANNLQAKPIIGLLAGSRVQEIKLMLPEMLKVAEAFPDYQFVIAGAPGISADLYSSIIGKQEIPIVYGQTYRLLQQCTSSLVTSGTATLETALFNVPEIVCYSTNTGTLLYKIGRAILKVKWISLVNLILDKEAVKELTQNLFKPKYLIPELEKILHNTTYRQSMLDDYRKLSELMGEPGASERAAKSIYEYTTG